MIEFPVYLDNCATTACDERVVQEMLPYFTQYYGNASSKSHMFGWKATAAVDDALERIAALVGASADEIIVTSGATESCNLVLRGITAMYSGKGNHIITTKTEHKAVLDTCRALEKTGISVTYLNVNEDGCIDLEALKNAIQPQTILIAIMTANNETGVLMPIADIGKIAEERGVLFFSDATQAVGKIPVHVKNDKVSLMAFSSHKLYGPKGVGALYISRKNPRVKLTAQITGGGQQKNVRSGTINVPGVVGFGKACQLCQLEQEEGTAGLSALRNLLETSLLELPDTFLNGDTKQRLPHVTNISFDYLNSNEILSVLNKSIAVSSGSACTSGTLDPSYVLTAMHKPETLARASIRFSLGRFTQEQEIAYTIKTVSETITHLRENSPAWLLRD